MHNKNFRPSNFSWLGFTLIVVGIIFLLDMMDIVNFGSFIGKWWPAILIFIGLVQLGTHNRSGSIVLILVGLIFLLINLDIVSWSMIFRFWPVLLIAVGVSILLRSKHWFVGKGEGLSQSTEDFVKLFAVFSGQGRSVTSQSFRGGEVFTAFGGIDLDLRQAKSSQEGCVLNLTALFGGIDLFVKPGTEVMISGAPIFGGIDNKTSVPDPVTVKDKIKINCIVAFGGIEIKN